MLGANYGALSWGKIRIKIKQAANHKGLPAVTVDGVLQKDHVIQLTDNGRDHVVEVIVSSSAADLTRR
ncbi:MAG: hypothetical protein K8F91_21625 [Candidatus Obscuribacterales bacterium]|nr:hypothetical protein [Candidatus Obscuribacterales bacterium]